MKKQLLTLLFAISSFITFSQVPSYVPTNGLVGYWPFNGNANDESGNGNNGTVYGATLVTDRNGSANKAYSFDGINDFIEVLSSSSVNFGLQSMSIHAWIKETGNNNNFNGLVCKMDPSGDGYQFVISNNKLQSEWGQSTSSYGSGLIGNVNLYDNNWHLVTMVIDRQANTLTFYNNNNIDNTTTGSTISLANIDNLANLWFGKERTSIFILKG